MLFLAVGLNGQQELARIFRKVPDVLTDLRPEMTKVGSVIRDRFAEVFRVEGAVAGFSRWAPLSERWTVKEREMQGYPSRNPILVRTAAYRRSFQADVERFSVSVSSNDKRDTMLQLGGKTGLGTVVPSRPITARVRAAFQANDWRQIIDILRNGLVSRWREGGIGPS